VTCQRFLQVETAVLDVFTTEVHSAHCGLDDCDPAIDLTDEGVAAILEVYELYPIDKDAA